MPSQLRKGIERSRVRESAGRRSSTRARGGRAERAERRPVRGRARDRGRAWCPAASKHSTYGSWAVGGGRCMAAMRPGRFVGNEADAHDQSLEVYVLLAVIAVFCAMAHLTAARPTRTSLFAGVSLFVRLVCSPIDGDDPEQLFAGLTTSVGAAWRPVYMRLVRAARSGDLRIRGLTCRSILGPRHGSG